MNRLLLAAVWTFVGFGSGSAAAAPPAKIEVTEAGVAKYLRYRAELLAETKRGLAEINEAGALAKKENEAKGLTRISEVSARVKKRGDEHQAKLLAQLGTSEEEMKVVEKVVQSVANARAEWRMGEPALKQIRESVAKIPPEHRAEGEEMVKKMEASQAKNRDLVAERKTYGDAPVDAVLKHEDEVNKMLKDWGLR